MPAMFEIITASLLDGQVSNYHFHHENEYDAYQAFNHMLNGAADEYYVLIEYYGSSWKIIDQVALRGHRCSDWFVSSTQDGLKVVESHSHRLIRERM